MFFNILKKEILLFSRDKGNLIMMFIFPILLITVLGYALNSVMGSSYDIFEDGKVYYHIEGKSDYKQGFEEFADKFEKEFDGIKFKKINNIENAKKQIKKNEAYGLITIDKDGYEYYRNPKGESSAAKIFREVFEGIIKDYSLIDLVLNTNPMMMDKIIKEKSREYTKDVKVGEHPISSIDYYTFAELCLIILYISTIVGESVVREKDFKTIDRISISKDGKMKDLLAKLSLGMIISIIQIGVVYIYSTKVLGANWGENLLPIMLNLICFAIFSVMLGIGLATFTKDGKIFSGMLSPLIMILCLLGGSYMPLSMLKSIPVFSTLTQISPIYWINSALISISTGVNDVYSKVAIGICLSFSLIILIAILIKEKIKGGEMSA
ncbi:MAG: ABC transporter permease [Terrisporobacter sp.]